MNGPSAEVQVKNQVALVDKSPSKEMDGCMMVKYYVNRD